MPFENNIVSGCIKIHKSAFVQEMLGANSCLRILINWKTSGDSPERHPAVSEPDSSGMITIDFKSLPYVNIIDSLEKLLTILKEKHRGKIRGRITCMGMYRNMYSFEIDMNSGDGKIEYIMG